MESFLSGGSAFNSVKTSSPEASSGFQPLFARTLAITPNKSAHPGDCEGQADPQIEVIEGPQGIERILIKCACGKQIELKCEY